MQLCRASLQSPPVEPAASLARWHWRLHRLAGEWWWRLSGGGGAGESSSQGGEGLLLPHFKKCSFQTVCTSLWITWKTFRSREIWQLAARYIKTAELVRRSRFRDWIFSQSNRRGGQSLFLYLNQRINDNEVAGSCTHDTVWNIFK